MSTSPQEPLNDDDIETTGTTGTGHGPEDSADADGADGTDAPGADADGTDA
jgi:hypothetical protein